MGASPIERLREAWRFSDTLFEGIGSGALHERPIRLRHPFIFYLGHLPAFAWNQVARGVLGRTSCRPEFDDLFERGIDPLSAGDPAAAERARWPPASEVIAWRDAVRAELPTLAEAVAEQGDRHVLAAGGRAWHVVLEHELMHHETLLYMIARLGVGRMRPVPDAGPPSPRPDPADGPVAIPAGPVRLGADFAAVPFGWDNEFPAHETQVAGFSIERHPVTNGRYRAFVEAGGYEEPGWWTPGGRAMLADLSLRQPITWRGRGGERRVETLWESVPFAQAAAWPVQVSWAEAAAYARWAGGRLPTEAEWHRAVYGTPEGTTRERPWGTGAPTAVHGNFGCRHWGPTPVGAHPAGASAFGLQDALGNAWEWTATVFAPFAGFEAYMPSYPGYSADFFDGDHFVLLGGSWATAPELLRRSFRNWFQPHYPYVFAGFRLAFDG